MQELKPCPFCGTEAVMTEHEPHDHSPGLVALTGIPAKHRGSWTIECIVCSCGMIHATRDEVVAAWNRRISASIADTAPVEMTIDEASAVDFYAQNPAVALQDFKASYKKLRNSILGTPVESIADTAGAKPVAEVVNKYGDPDSFAERDLIVNEEILKSLPFGTQLFAATPASSVADAARASIIERPSRAISEKDRKDFAKYEAMFARKESGK